MNHVFQAFVNKETKSDKNLFTDYKKDWEGVVWLKYTTPDEVEEAIFTYWDDLFFFVEENYNVIPK